MKPITEQLKREIEKMSKEELLKLYNYVLDMGNEGITVDEYLSLSKVKLICGNCGEEIDWCVGEYHCNKCWF